MGETGRQTCLCLDIERKAKELLTRQGGVVPDSTDIPQANGFGSMWIGNFHISVFPGGGYWIRHNSGEGGRFKAELVEKAIADFYNENF